MSPRVARAKRGRSAGAAARFQPGEGQDLAEAADHPVRPERLGRAVAVAEGDDGDADTGRAGGGDVLRVVGTHELKLSDYGLKAPSLMMGTMKVGDVVKVGFDLVLRGEPKVASTE